MSTELPIVALRPALLLALEQGPVVVSSPTGSGKSTEVPRWCEGRTLVVEPRRIACRSLATRVAELEGTALGDGVGYLVRDERVAHNDTRILFATPGMALRNRALLESARTVVLDEFHERSLEIDLLLSLLLRREQRRLIVMSATLDGERVANHIGGVHLCAEGRAFEVELRYLSGRDVLPDATDLPGRVRRALETAATDPGDVLVFLPGKAEIEQCAQALSQVRGAPHTLFKLHGGLTLDEQRRVFEPARNRKVILATNVAETSLTIPGIGVVIDTGLVRKTHYHEGRAHLSLGPIADDSAAQRAGRAGRTAKGVCYRLWSQAARLEPRTAPGIHRESLVPLLLAAAAWGERPESLPLLDAAKPYALEAARADLEAWGALDAQGALSPGGVGMFGMPVDALQARLLLTAKESGCLEDMIDLVAALSVGRPLFLAGPGEHLDSEDLRSAGCDVTALVRAVRSETPAEHAISGYVLDEVRRTRARLRRLEGLPDTKARDPGRAFDREALLRAAITADARVVYVARTRGQGTFFSNGGTELELARESAARNLRTIEALLVLDTRGFGTGRDARVLITCAAQVPLSWIARAGLGQDRLASVQLDRKRVIAKIERVYAKRVIAEREEVPEGEVAREAIAALLERGSLFRDAVNTTRSRLARSALATQLAARSQGVMSAAPAADLGAFLRDRIAALGVESGEDLALLSASDFLAPELPYEVASMIDRDFPESVSVGDASYRAEYDLSQNLVTLHMVKGSRRDPPPLAYLPKFPGLRIAVAGPRGIALLRQRGSL